jgi:hypothetical protein
MTPSLYRDIRRAGLALTAGVLGLAAPTWAQTPVGPLGHASTAPLTEVGPATAADAPTRLLEMKVELAWMADPAVFPHRLAVRFAGGALEVRGFVPGEAVREQALKVAREAVGVHVLDGLRVHPNLSLRAGAGGTESIEPASRAALAEALPDQAGGIAVKATPGGQVTLSGVVASHEAKLAAGHALRRVAGCASVVNQLRVATVLVNGRGHERVSADGMLLVGSDGSVITVEENTQPRLPTPPPLRPETPPVVRPAKPAPAPRAPEMPARVESPPTYSLPARPVRLEEPAEPAVEIAKPVAKPVPPAPPKPKEPAPVRRVSHTAPKPATVAPRPVAPGAPYVATGVVLIEGLDLPVEPAAPAADLAAVGTQMRQKIVAVFGDKVNGIEVTALSPTSLTIRLRAANASDGQRLASAVFKMPELRPYQVNLEIDLKP